MLLVQYEVTVSPSSLIVLAIKVYFQGPISLEGKLEIKQRSCDEPTRLDMCSLQSGQG